MMRTTAAISSFSLVNAGASHDHRRKCRGTIRRPSPSHAAAAHAHQPIPSTRPSSPQVASQSFLCLLR